MQLIMGWDIQSFYLFALIVAGLLCLLNILFGDILAVEAGSLLNPTVVLSFLSMWGAFGYILDTFSALGSLTVLVTSTLLSLIFVSMIHLFILIPLSKAEESTVYSMKDLLNKEGEVSVTIPTNGNGEIMLNSNHGIQNYIALSIHHTEIKEGTKIKVVGINDDVLEVQAINKPEI